MIEIVPIEIDGKPWVPTGKVCTDPDAIKYAQAVMGTRMTGLWSLENQAALDETGETFKGIVPGCTGNPPAAGAKSGGDIPQVRTTRDAPAANAAIVPGNTTWPAWLSDPLLWVGAGAVLLVVLMMTSKGSKK